MPGYILHESRASVVIATLSSGNRKTGDMVQVWILHRHVAPTVAVQTGQDGAVCGDCPLRPINIRKAAVGRLGCYVAVSQAPTSIWRAYKRGSYQKLALHRYAEVFGGRTVRLGAYGDPAFIPARVVHAIVRVAAGHTGYTHQWRRPFAAHLKGVCMASCETERQARAAAAAGWGAFLSRPSGAASASVGILCPSERGTKCSDCLLCDGTAGRTIWIPVHGAGSRAVDRLIQIAEARESSAA